MLCCLNPDCDRPIDPDGHAHCQNCGVPLVALLYNRFKVVNPIGRGGFGKTYLAEDTHKLSDRCVIKQLAYRGQGTQSVQPANAVLQDLQEPPPVLLTVPLSIPPISPTVPISTSPLSLSVCFPI
jgi:serine/threonine protein kinase